MHLFCIHWHKKTELQENTDITPSGTNPSKYTDLQLKHMDNLAHNYNSDFVITNVVCKWHIFMFLRKTIQMLGTVCTGHKRCTMKIISGKRSLRDTYKYMPPHNP